QPRVLPRFRRDRGAHRSPGVALRRVQRHARAPPGEPRRQAPGCEMSRIEIFDTLEQGTDEWRRVRAGIPTCSEFDLVRAKPGPRGGVTRELQGRTPYMRQLAGERITGEPMPHFETWAMRRGKEVEPQAARYYAITFDVELHRVGFVKNGN